jgi:hypothetical protein
MILNPLEKTRLSARLLQLRALLQAGTLAPLEKARASAEAIAIRTKLGAAVVPAPGGETADDLAELEQDDGLSDDPNSPNYRYRDTGYIPGSRKEEAARMIREAGASGVMLRASDIDFEAIEQNPREARKLITKSNLFGQVDWAALEEGGMEPAAGVPPGSRLCVGGQGAGVQHRRIAPALRHGHGEPAHPPGGL